MEVVIGVCDRGDPCVVVGGIALPSPRSRPSVLSYRTDRHRLILWATLERRIAASSPSAHSAAPPNRRRPCRAHRLTIGPLGAHRHLPRAGSWRSRTRGGHRRKGGGQPSGSQQAVPGMTLDECSGCSPDQDRPTPSASASHDLSMDGAQAITFATPAKPESRSGRQRERDWSKRRWARRFVSWREGRTWPTCDLQHPRGEGYVEVDVIGPSTVSPHSRRSGRWCRRPSHDSDGAGSSASDAAPQAVAYARFASRSAGAPCRGTHRTVACLINARVCERILCGGWSDKR